MLQHDYLFEWRTVLDNVLIGPEILRLDMGRARERARDVLRRYGLGQFMDHYPQQLSGGMRQRAALARTLCTEPDILLLDEPFSALDFQTRLALADEVWSILKREGKTVILVTHDISEAVAMADRVVVMSRRPGRIKAEHDIAFANGGGNGHERPVPFKARSAPEFPGYFNRIWNELEIHVGD
jgi:NitT/TauT family transport system ATP-binding protein